MEQQHEAILTGSDSPVEGIVTPINHTEHGKAYEFLSIDGTLHLIIARDRDGHWIRIAGTEPYLSGWTSELASQVKL